MTTTTPVLVENRPDGLALYWGDIHGHSGLTDGRGTPEAYYAYARDVSFLDISALTDHDWQLTESEFLRAHQATDAAYAPGRFITIMGMEINWIGHEVIYFFDSKKLAGLRIGRKGGVQEFWHELYTNMADEGTELMPYPQIVSAYGQKDMMIIGHTTLSKNMGGPLADPLPGQKAIEVYSAHGSSECAKCPNAIPTAPDQTSSVRQWLLTGHRMAMVAAGDSHDGRPGNSLFSGRPGGLTGFYLARTDRKGVYDAIEKGRTFGTNGCRAVLDFSINGHPMGSTFQDETVKNYRFRVVAPFMPMTVVMVKNGHEYEAITSSKQGQWIDFTDSDTKPAVIYLRAQSEDNSCIVWSSPIRIEAP
jgi:hypothetical protein